MDIAAFVKWVIQESCWEGCDLDGADVQAQAVACGIVVETKFDPAVHGSPTFADDVQPGDSWFVFSDEFKSGKL